MAKLTIEIDMEDSQEAWDALYRRIEEFGEDEKGEKGKRPIVSPATYDLLLDPEHSFGDTSDFFAVFSGHD